MSLPGFDAEWYRKTYPDVMRAGMDPELHYLRHGRAEGRFPRPLRSLVLEEALWGGFAKLALPDLLGLYESSHDPEEKVYAAWALARWYASECAWSDALPFIGILRGTLPSFLDHPGPTLLGVDVLFRTKRVEEAHSWLSAAIAKNPHCTDWFLAAANVCLPKGGLCEDQKNLKLAWLNQLWQRAGLSYVRKKKANAPLALENLQPLIKQHSRGEECLKISVLMPAFNASSWIETAIQSLLSQTWKNLEVIVIDDDSGDDTVNVVTKLARLDSRIILLRQCENQGAYAARNLGLKHATGEFVTNHDSDDWSHPERLEKMCQPLLSNARIVASVASWVRIDENLHFQAWRIERGLVGPSVATLLCRRDVLNELGGWDNVRVAADFELHQRLLRAYGNEAVAAVMPGIPLVLARQIPGSLTSSSDTHLRTMFFGLRKLYQELFETWHTMGAGPRDLCLDHTKRLFPAPKKMIKQHSGRDRYDWLLIGDLSECSRGYQKAISIVHEGISKKRKIAVFHWPRYDLPSPLGKYFLSKAVEWQLDIVLANQDILASDVFIIDEAILCLPPDQPPRVLYDRCQTVSIKETEFSPLIDKTSVTVENRSTYEKPKEFDADWYLQRNPDVKKKGIDPWLHYLDSGHAEGREPAPNFNTPFYRICCQEAKETDLPALLHYMTRGQILGCSPEHPVFTGKLVRYPERPNVLLCGHAAGDHLFGAERCLLDVLEVCLHLRVNVFVTVPSVINIDYISLLRSKSVKVFCVPTTVWQDGVGPCTYAIEKIEKIIRDESIDIVQANTVVLREPLIAARNAGARALVHAHEVPEGDGELCRSIGLSASEIRRKVLELADGMLANSIFTSNSYGHPNTLVVGGNLADDSLLDLQNTLPQKGIVAGLISSNQPKKGLRDFVTLARELRKMKSSVRLCLIGPENEYSRALCQAIETQSVPNNIIVTGYARTPKEAISQCNVVLSLSRCQETFGRTVLEAMAAGRPVIGYRYGAIPELVIDGETGFLVDLGDVKKIAERLLYLSQHQDLVALMGQAGRREASKYSIKSTCGRLRKAYIVH